MKFLKSTEIKEFAKYVRGYVIIDLIRRKLKGKHLENVSKRHGKISMKKRIKNEYLKELGIFEDDENYSEEDVDEKE
jgi:hypothetical protein